MFALADDTKTSFLEGADSVLVVDPRDPRHASDRDFNLPDNRPAQQFVAGSEILTDSVLDVGQRLCVSAGGCRVFGGQSRRWVSITWTMS